MLKPPLGEFLRAYTFRIVIHFLAFEHVTAQFIAELTECSPIILQNSRTHQAEKIWMYDHTTIRPYKVLLLTCVVNCTAGTPMPQPCPVVQWSVHWALSQMTRVLVLAGLRRCVLETYKKKKMRALLLGLAKSLYY